MTHTTQPIFILGSGRSGTRALFKALRLHRGTEVHHEFACTHIQPVAAKYFMGLTDKDQAVDALVRIHAAAVYWSLADRWIDASNKLTWLIEPLTEVFPDARFVHVVRDGRKVALSFFRKLTDEMYDDQSVSILSSWLRDPSLPEPPPEKKYWWNIPRNGQPFEESFPQFDQFQRAVYHWIQSNRTARDDLKAYVSEERFLTVRLEDVVNTRSELVRLLEFLDVDVIDAIQRSLKTPQNVIVPIDYKLTPTQRSQFNELAAQDMDYWGYDITAEEYSVEY